MVIPTPSAKDEVRAVARRTQVNHGDAALGLALE